MSVVRAKYGILDAAAADLYHHALNTELMDRVLSSTSTCGTIALLLSISFVRLLEGLRMLHNQMASLFELFASCYYSCQIKEDEIGRVCRMRGGKWSGFVETEGKQTLASNLVASIPLWSTRHKSTRCSVKHSTFYSLSAR